VKEAPLQSTLWNFPEVRKLTEKRTEDFGFIERQLPMNEPHNMPPDLQCDLYEQGVLDNPDYKRDDKGKVTLNLSKLDSYIAEHGQPWF
jgi:hypothetical protein